MNTLLWLRSPLLLLLSLTVGLSLPIPPAQAQPAGTPPTPIRLSARFQTRGSPRQTAGGANRSIIATSAAPCSVNPNQAGATALPPEGLLMLLVPPPLPGAPKVPEVTIAERPTLLLHVPDRGGYTVDISVALDITTIYEGTVTLPPAAGIVQLPLPASLPALTIGRPYEVALTLFCNQRDLKQVRTLTYPITRVAVPATVHPQATGDPLQFVNDLAHAGIWFDAVSSLAALRQSQPTSPVIQAEWRELLQSVALDGLADQPLLDCCQLPEPSPR